MLNISPSDQSIQFQQSGTSHSEIPETENILHKQPFQMQPELVPTEYEETPRV